MTIRLALSAFALCFALAVPAPVFSTAQAQEPALKVVSTFSILGDIAARVGGDRIAHTNLVGPGADSHVYEPTPTDAAAIAGADVVLANGLGFEGFLDRLIEASETKATVVTATKGITPLPAEGHGEREGHGDKGEAAHADGHSDHNKDEAQAAGHSEKHAGEEHAGEEHADGEHAAGHAGHGHDHGAFDPHAWHAVPLVKTYVANIADAFCAADGEGCETYRANASAYTAELDALDAEVRATLAALPENRRTLIVSHDAFGYFADAYGLRFLAPQGLSTESEASAADVARLIDQIRADGASGLFVENVADPRLIERIADETGLKVGGKLYSGALSPADGPAATYVEMIRHNAETIAAAVKGS